MRSFSRDVQIGRTKLSYRVNSFLRIENIPFPTICHFGMGNRELTVIDNWIEWYSPSIFCRRHYYMIYLKQIFNFVSPMRNRSLVMDIYKNLYIFSGVRDVCVQYVIYSYLWESIVREGGFIPVRIHRSRGWGWLLYNTCLQGALPSFGCVVPTVFDELSSLV